MLFKQKKWVFWLGLWGREYRALYLKLHFNQGKLLTVTWGSIQLPSLPWAGDPACLGNPNPAGRLSDISLLRAVGVSSDINQHETFSSKKSPIWKGFTAKGGKVFKGKTTQHAAPEAKLNFHFRSEHSVRAECSSTSYSKLFFLSYISVHFRLLYKLL